MVYIIGGFTTDALITYLNTKYSKPDSDGISYFLPYGNIRNILELGYVKARDDREYKSVSGRIFDIVMGPCLDGMIGASINNKSISTSSISTTSVLNKASIKKFINKPHIPLPLPPTPPYIKFGVTTSVMMRHTKHHLLYTKDYPEVSNMS